MTTHRQEPYQLPAVAFEIAAACSSSTAFVTAACICNTSQRRVNTNRPLHVGETHVERSPLPGRRR